MYANVATMSVFYFLDTDPGSKYQVIKAEIIKFDPIRAIKDYSRQQGTMSELINNS